MHSTYPSFLQWLIWREKFNASLYTSGANSSLNTSVAEKNESQGGEGGYENVTCANAEQSKRWCAELSKNRNLTSIEKVFCVLESGPKIITGA